MTEFNPDPPPAPGPGIRVLGQPAAPRAEATPEGPAGSSLPAARAEDAGGAAAAHDADDAYADEDTLSVGRLVNPRVVMVLLAVALAGICGTVAFGLLWAHDQSKQASATRIQTDSRAVAVSFLRDFTTFDPATVGRTFSDIQAMSTGSFATQAKTEFSPQLQQQLQAANASTQGALRYLELQSYTTTTTGYFADVVQTFSNKNTKAPQSDELRLVIDLSLVKGQWKISGVTSLDTPVAAGG
ncbi:MAG TPA: hypothetical protein VMU63_02915 [Acidimicrobiales bacterium]|nr:hypothetical protein [Acidimicrobiales bacterium]